MRSCCLLCRHSFVTAPLQSTVPGAALRSVRLCHVPTAASHAGGERRLLNWKKPGTGSNEGEETCEASGQGAAGETFGCHVSLRRSPSAMRTG